MLAICPQKYYHPVYIYNKMIVFKSNSCFYIGFISNYSADSFIHYTQFASSVQRLNNVDFILFFNSINNIKRFTN